MTPEEIRGWAAIILGALATLGVAIIAARAAWRNSRKTSSEAVELRTWPTYGELVTENRNLRKEVDDLRVKVEGFGQEMSEFRTHQSDSERRERILFHYLSALRDHILRELPPPPPAVPAEITDWFEDFEATMPRSGPS